MSGRTVWKYVIDPEYPPGVALRFRLPEGARFLRAMKRPEGLAVWAEVPDRAAPAVDRWLAYTGTGQEVPAGWVWIDTLAEEGFLIWHVWEVVYEGLP